MCVCTGIYYVYFMHFIIVHNKRKTNDNKKLNSLQTVMSTVFFFKTFAKDFVSIPISATPN